MLPKNAIEELKNIRSNRPRTTMTEIKIVEVFFGKNTFGLFITEYNKSNIIPVCARRTLGVSKSVGPKGKTTKERTNNKIKIIMLLT